MVVPSLQFHSHGLHYTLSNHLVQEEKWRPDPNKYYAICLGEFKGEWQKQLPKCALMPSIFLAMTLGFSFNQTSLPADQTYDVYDLMCVLLDWYALHFNDILVILMR